MKIKSALIIAFAIALAVLVSGCDSDVVSHEPGVYKGQRDPEAGQAAADRRAKTLQDRAKDVFTDR
jgi:hypothetical protein